MGGLLIHLCLFCYFIYLHKKVAKAIVSFWRVKKIHWNIRISKQHCDGTFLFQTKSLAIWRNQGKRRYLSVKSLPQVYCNHDRKTNYQSLYTLLWFGAVFQMCSPCIKSHTSITYFNTAIYMWTVFITKH